MNRVGLHFLSALFVCALCSACNVITYTAPTGEKFSRTAFGQRTSVQSLLVESGTNGIQRVTLRGYSNDQVEVFSAITEAAVRGAVKP